MVARDAATEERAALESQVAELELRMTMQRKRQDEMVDQLEQALAMSFGPLEAMFDKTDLDVDNLIDTVRSTHSGQGGPLGTATVSTRSFDDPELGDRFDQLMLGLDRMNLMRIAASKVPYAFPVDGSYRFTSGFGPRGRRLHAGIDLAGPVGTIDHRHRRRRGDRRRPGKRLWQRRPGPARVRIRDGLCPLEQNPGQGGTTGIAWRANR